MVAAFGKLVLITCMLFGLPLFGVMLAGLPVESYLEFPPSTRYVEHAAFSWPVFIGVLAFVTAVCLPFLFAMLSGPKVCRGYLSRVRPFPWWGWCGVAFLALAWILAWTRFPWFESLQSFTFTPLWLAYIVIVNALTFRRTGHCIIRDHPGFFLSLFPLSALFWWFFEYLNRFVQNWYYVSVDTLGPVEYVVHATLPFATVLPAVLSTLQFLESFPHLDRAFRADHPRIHVFRFPAYAPELNPVEYLWAYLKLNPLANLALMEVHTLADATRRASRSIQHRPGLLRSFVARSPLSLRLT